MKKIKATSIAIVLSFPLSAYAAVDAQCVINGIKSKTIDETINSKVHFVSCAGGQIIGLLCQQAETKDYYVEHDLDAGWEYIPDTVSVDLRNGRYMERIKATITKRSKDKITVHYQCKGHPCGGPGASYSEIYMIGGKKRRLNSSELAEIIKSCGF